ncbi:MAG: hypothetical protein WKF36_05635 [Candidatus Nitrosocosmicus sp.]
MVVDAIYLLDFFKNSNNDASQQGDLSIAEKEQDLPKEIMEKKQKGLLKTGLTTGTSASAATKALYWHSCLKYLQIVSILHFRKAK